MTVLVWILLPVLTPFSLILATLALQRWENALLPSGTADTESADAIVEVFGQAPQVSGSVTPLLVAER